MLKEMRQKKLVMDEKSGHSLGSMLFVFMTETVPCIQRHVTKWKQAESTDTPNNFRMQSPKVVLLLPNGSLDLLRRI